MAKQVKAKEVPFDKGGRHPTYSTLQELEERIESYFEHCKKGRRIKRYDKQEKCFVTETVELPQTIEGLAYHLGMTRQSLLNYQNIDADFFDTITRAKERINVWKMETAWLGDVDPRVWQFDLKNNANYKDKAEEEESKPIEKTTSEIDLGNGAIFKL